MKTLLLILLYLVVVLTVFTSCSSPREIQAEFQEAVLTDYKHTTRQGVEKVWLIYTSNRGVIAWVFDDWPTTHPIGEHQILLFKR